MITHNLVAMNANRQYNITTVKKAKSTEKLSSGFKINRAADDAAGLSISEKMRKQIRGLTQAKYNVQDGVSLCQVKDGALGEVQDMLHRMNELSVQSANGTLSPDDRSYLQQEVEQLATEIDRIGYTTKFNELPVFNYEGSMGPGNTSSKIIQLVKSEAAETGYMTEAYAFEDGGTIKYSPAAILDFSAINSENIQYLDQKSFRFSCTWSCNEAFQFTFVNRNGNGSTVKNKDGRVEHQYEIDIHGLSSAEELLNRLVEFVGDEKNKPEISNRPGDVNEVIAQNGIAVSHSNVMIKEKDSAILVLASCYTGAIKSSEADAKKYFASKTGKYGKADVAELAAVNVGYIKSNELPIQAGAEAGEFIWLKMPKMNATEIGVKDIDVTTPENALTGIDKVSKALEVIANQRSTAGAEQNRLEHAYNVDDNVAENTQASESVIRDTDMAKEMVANSLQNILAQAGQSMLAQANQSNQGVLSLLS